MRSGIWYLHTQQEHGHTEARLRLAAGAFLGCAPSDSRLQPQRDAKGKLYFPLAPMLHCSVSHSGGVWLCALSQLPVGVDLQVHTVCPQERIAARFFHESERRWLETQPPERFFDVWSAKESYMKYTGAGLELGLDQFSVVAGDQLADTVGGVPLRMVSFLPQYSMCICGAVDEALELRMLTYP